ncbi:MAG: pseudouridine synthase [Bacilli bacterium]
MIRLDKLLSHMGYGSRKDVKKIIRQGRVEINGEYIFDDDIKVNELEDEIFIDNNMIDSYKENIYIMLNKPKNVVSATFDFNDETVVDLVSEYVSYKIFPVGRLDKDTEGLILLTNDGKLAHSLLSPKKHIEKEYYAELDGDLTQKMIDIFGKGVVLDDGYICKSSKLIPINSRTARVIIYEGKYHQIKRMFNSVGINVIFLKRKRMGTLNLDENLKSGEYRLLTSQEIDKIKL